MLQAQNFEWSILCDHYFTVRLELFSRIVTDFATCFRRRLSKSKDASFSLMGQLCRFVRKLCSRCFIASYVPKDNEWVDLLTFTIDDEKLLHGKDVLDKLKLTTKVEAACALKADQFFYG